MWKLTIKQSHPDSYLKNEVSFYSEDIIDLTVLIEKFSRFGVDKETAYTIERVGVVNE